MKPEEQGAMGAENASHPKVWRVTVADRGVQRGQASAEQKEKVRDASREVDRHHMTEDFVSRIMDF